MRLSLKAMHACSLIVVFNLVCKLRDALECWPITGE